jgi:glycosyltransferase involved in cell wall biosynthesis
MEAMACNLPVITTKFGGLPRIFEEDGGILYAEKQDDFYHLLKRVLNEDLTVETRKKVLPYSWERVSQELEKIYYELIMGIH